MDFAGAVPNFAGRASDFAGGVQDFAGTVPDFTGRDLNFAGAVLNFAARLANCPGTAADFAGRVLNFPRGARTSRERGRISREAKMAFPMHRRFWIGHVKVHGVAISLSWLESVQSDGVGVRRNIVGEIDGEPIDGADG